MTRAHHTVPLHFTTAEDVVALVRARGGRLSAPRRRVLDALFAAGEPLSADAIATDLGLEPTSVYRNLDALERLGAVRHVHLGHGPGLYALESREYLVCEVCDAVTRVAPAQLDAVRAEIRSAFGFRARFDHFPILGVCAACAGTTAGMEEHEHTHPHAHAHTHEDGETHVHAHTEHDHDHVEHEHEHSHGDVTHTHPHVHEEGLEHDHAHDH